MADAAILEVEGLDAAYGQAQILFDVSLNVARGEIVALMGRNGAGKSTTLKAIMGLVPRARPRAALRRPRHRRACRATASPGSGSATCRRSGASSPTSPSTRTWRSAPRPPLPARAARPWTPERLFAIFPNLAEMRGRRASQMSGGEQQMLTIARTLMGNPEAVLLDEPSEGLAPVIVEQMAAAVLRMKAEGIAVLLSEQNLHFAAAVADRTYIIEKGAIRHEGRMADIAADAALREAYLTV